MEHGTAFLLPGLEIKLGMMHGCKIEETVHEFCRLKKETSKRIQRYRKPFHRCCVVSRQSSQGGSRWFTLCMAQMSLRLFAIVFFLRGIFCPALGKEEEGEPLSLRFFPQMQQARQRKEGHPGRLLRPCHLFLFCLILPPLQCHLEFQNWNEHFLFQPDNFMQKVCEAFIVLCCATILLFYSRVFSSLIACHAGPSLLRVHRTILGMNELNKEGAEEGLRFLFAALLRHFIVIP